jgi:CDP-glucose 4,6-dehydratase
VYRDVYKNCKVLVTGHTGFKGSWLTTMLEMLGSEVMGVSLPEQENSLFRKIKNGLTSSNSFVDIRDRTALNKVMEKFKPDLVFHLAAQSLVLESYKNPVDTFSTNVMGTAHLLEASLDAENLKGLVIITTDKVYRNLESGKAFSEEDSLGGNDPYSGSKAACEIVVESWRPLFEARDTKVNLVTVRAGNVIGGGDEGKNRLLPDLISSIRGDTKLTLRNPHATRPWQHVIDALHGYLILGEKIFLNEKVAQSYNFGPSNGAELSVMQVVNTIEELSGKRFDISIEDSKFHESELLKLDSSLAADDLGWESQLTSNEALNLTLDFLSVEHSSFHELMKMQISRYWGVSV